MIGHWKTSNVFIIIYEPVRDYIRLFSALKGVSIEREYNKYPKNHINNTINSNHSDSYPSPVFLPPLPRTFRIRPCSNHSTNFSNDNSPTKHSSRSFPASSDHVRNSTCVIFFVRTREWKRLYAFLYASKTGFSETFRSYRIIAPISLHFLLLSPYIRLYTIAVLSINPAHGYEEPSTVLAFFDEYVMFDHFDKLKTA